MAEIWGAAIMVGGAVLSAQAAKKKAAQDKKDGKEMTLEGAKYGAMQSQFESEQEHYYNQLEKQERLRGLDEFRKFSTVNQFAPQYANSNPNPVVLPAKPDAKAFFAPDPVAPGGGGKKKSLHEKLDPLGSAIFKNDKKMFKKIFG
jgi:hypothetical protein